MFETSSLSPMLGMAAQMKGAVQGKNAAQGLSLGLQMEPGVELQQALTADPTGSLFQLMLGIALPQAVAPSARPASESAGDSTNLSIALPFASDELEASGEEQIVTASAMMPFYPVMWNAVPTAAIAEEAVAAGNLSGQTAAAETGIQDVKAVTAPAPAVSAEVANAVSGTSQIQAAAGSAGAGKGVNDPAMAAALAAMAPVQDAGTAGETITAEAAAQSTASAAQPHPSPEMKIVHAAPEMNASAATGPDAASVAAAGGETLASDGRMAGANVKHADEPAAVPAATDARMVERAAPAAVPVATDARTAESAAPAVPVRETSGERPAVAAPRKQTAALAWAESILRKHATAQAVQQTASPAPVEAHTGGVGSPSVNVQQAIVEKDAITPSAAPEAQVHMHEAVMAAAPDTVKTSGKSARTATAPAQPVPTVDAAGTERRIPDVKTESAEVPVVSPGKAEPAHVRGEAPARSASDAPSEVLPVKADGAQQQPLASVHDAQQQTAPVTETKTVATPRAREAVFEQVFREVSTIRHTPGTVDVTLSPESLGRVNIRVGLEEGKMTARIDVQNVEVKHIVEANMPRLHEVLQQNGITLDSVAVSVNTGSSFAEKRNDAPKKKTNGSSTALDDGFEPLSAAGDSKHYGYNTVEYIM